MLKIGEYPTKKVAMAGEAGFLALAAICHGIFKVSPSSVSVITSDLSSMLIRCVGF
jgi:hypothetical protein